MRAIHVYGVLRADIENGRYPAGKALPSLKELAREFGVAVGTVQQALKRLDEDGLVERRSRQGTFVRDSAPHAGPLAQLQSILESATDAIITKSLDGTILSWNRGAERLYGYTEAEVVGRPISILLPPDRPNELPEVFRRLRLGQAVEPYESVRLRKDGRRVDVVVSITPLRDSAGQVVGATAIARDVTKHNDAERQNREHALMLDAVGDAVIAIDLDGIIRYWNRGAERLYGWTADEVLGRAGRFFVAPTLSEELVLQHRRDLATGTGLNAEWELTRKDGSTFLARVSTTPLWEPDGTLSGFIGVSSDLTMQKETEERLRESEALFAAAFRANPAAIVITAVEDGRIIEVNGGCEQILGYCRDELIGKSVFEFSSGISPEERQALVEQIHEHGTLSMTSRLPHRSGGMRDVAVSMDVIDVAGQQCFLSTIVDITERKQSLEELRRSEERYRTLFAATPVGIIAGNGSGIAGNPDGVIECNEAYTRLLGYTGEDWKTITWQSVTHPEDLERERPLFDELVRGERDHYTIEKRYIHKNGSEIWVNATITAARDDTGRMLFDLAVIEDITARKHAAAALEESERRYREVVRDMPVGVVVHRADGTIEATSDAALQMLGRQALDPTWTCIHEDGSPYDLNQRASEVALRTGSPVRGDIIGVYRPATKEPMWLHVDALPQRDESGRVDRVIVTFIDITARKLAEEALERSQEWYRSVVEASTDGVIVQSLDGQIIFANPRAASLLGHQSAAELIGKPVIGLFPPEEHGRVIRENRKLIARGTYEVAEFQARRHDGTTFPIEVSGTAIKNDQGRPVALTGVFRDITGRKRVMEAVQRSERRYRAIFEKAPIGIASGDRSGHIVTCNEAYWEMLGYTDEELKALGFQALTHPDDLAKDVEQFKKLVAAEIEGYEMTKRMIRKDGTLIWVHLAISAIRDSEGNFLTDIALVEDITQHIQMQAALRASEERFRVAFEGAPIGVVLANMSGQPIAANAVFQEMVGRSEEELRRVDFTAMTHPDDVEADLQLAVELFAGMRDSYQMDKRYVRPDGSIVWAHLAASVVRDGDGEPQFAICMVEDITERRQTEEALRASEERYRAVIETSQDGIIIRDLNGVILIINERGCELMGFNSPAEAIGHKVMERVVRDDLDMLRNSTPRLMQEGRDAIELTLIGRNGHRFPAEMRRTVMKDADGQPYAVAVAVRDVTERKRYEDELRRRALYDPLTGLANRTLFEDRVVRALQTSRRDSSAVSVLLLDLDRFKDVNDTLGHASGDVLLQQVAARFERELRNADTVARLGGDEFAILLVGDGRLQAESVATRVLAALAEPFEIGDHLLYSNASVGIAISPEHGMDLATLLRRADIAMYTAKRGAHGYMVYEPASDSQSTRRLTLISDLQRAIDGNDLILHFQPLVDTDTGTANRAEALARWIHPELGFVSPGEFIPLAEQTGLIKPLTVWLLNEALRQVAEWRSEGLQVSVAVNLSTLNFQDRNLVDLVGTALERYGLPPCALTLEITESALMADPARARDTVIFLRDMGVLVAIDDFGTGYSSLGYLQKLPVHEVKIDRSFITEISVEHPESLSIVRAMLSLGQTLGMTVVAEGVETQQQLDILTTAGCGNFQGYFFSKPLPADAYREWLEVWEATALALKARSA